MGVFVSVSVRHAASCGLYGLYVGHGGGVRYLALRHSHCPSSIASSVRRFHLFDIGRQWHFRPSAFLALL